MEMALNRDVQLPLRPEVFLIELSWEKVSNNSYIY